MEVDNKEERGAAAECTGPQRQRERALPLLFNWSEGLTLRRNLRIK